MKSHFTQYVSHEHEKFWKSEKEAVLIPTDNIVSAKV
jgi:hypothetical protein